MQQVELGGKSIAVGRFALAAGLALVCDGLGNGSRRRSRGLVPHAYGRRGGEILRDDALA